MYSYSLKVFIVFLKLGQLFPGVQLFVVVVVVVWGGRGGGGQQASSLNSSKHKLWNFHRYWLVGYKRH